MSEIRDRVEQRVKAVFLAEHQRGTQFNTSMDKLVTQILSIPELAEGLKLYEQLHKEWGRGKKPPIRFPSPNPY